MREKNLQYLLIYFVLFIISVFLYFLNLLGAFNRIYDASIKIIRPMIVVTDTITLEVSNSFHSMFNTTRLRDENLALSAETLRLKQRILELQNQLSQCNDLQENKDKDKKQIEILDKFYTTVGYIEINAGRKQGLQVGSVITFNGFLVGYVSDVFDYTAIVETIYAPQFKQKVYFDKAKITGILTKEPNGFFVHEVLLKDKVLVDDKIYVLNPVDNKKIYIGTVKKVKSPLSSPKKIVEIQPYVNLNNLIYVYTQ